MVMNGNTSLNRSLESDNMEEKYTLEQILNAITQAGQEIVCAIN